MLPRWSVRCAVFSLRGVSLPMHEFLLFSTAAGQRLLPVQDVVEVIPFVKLQPENSNNPLFRGLLNYRGQILPVFDFVPASQGVAADYRCFLVVVQARTGAFCLVAQEVNHLLAVPDDGIFPVTAAPGQQFDVVKSGDAMIRIVSMEEFIA